MHMSRHKPTHIALIIAFATLVFANSLPGAFVWDDEIQIVKNWRIRSLENLPSALTTSFWSFLGTEAENQTNFYRPIQTITYTWAYAIGGLSPVPYHLFSLVYHSAASVFVYLIGIELMLTPAAAFAIAGLFAVHPIHTEAVAWIAGIPDVACGAFYFGSLWFFLRKRPLLSCLFFFAALLSKEMAVTLPFFLLLSVKSVKSVAKHFIVLGLYLIMRVFALGLLATSHLQVQASWLDWCSLAARVLGDYVRYALIPYPLNAFHLIPLKFEYRIVSTLAALAGILLIAAIIWYYRQRLPQALFWSSSFVLMLIPVFYFKGMSNTFFAERYLYIPSFAMIALVVTTLWTLKVPNRNVILGAIGIAFALSAIYRNEVWHTSEQLYETTLALQPEVAHMSINLSDIHLKRNDDSGARKLLMSAQQSMQADTYVVYPYEQYRAYVGLGALDARAGRFVEAREEFKKAIEVNPNGDWGYLYLGGVFMEADRDYPKAIENFKKAIQLGPLNETARDYLGVAMLNQKNYPEAIRNFEEALKINPNYEDARNHLAIASRASR
jgi:tetratricopeptide (TPR) repeat protein